MPMRAANGELAAHRRAAHCESLASSTGTWLAASPSSANWRSASAASSMVPT